MNFWILIQGFGLGASMIIPIGAQNAFVLNQGINRHHHLTTAALCSLIDATLISLGVFGGGAIISQNEILLNLVTCGGIAFLCFYGYLSLKNIFVKRAESLNSTSVQASRYAVIMGVLAVSLLNPHVYLDTVVVLGSVGGQFEGAERFSFALGTMMASFIWFFSISIAAAKFAPTLSKQRVKIGIDICVAIIMLFIAASLASNLWSRYL